MDRGCTPCMQNANHLFVVCMHGVEAASSRCNTAADRALMMNTMCLHGIMKKSVHHHCILSISWSLTEIGEILLLYKILGEKCCRNMLLPKK